MANETTCIGLIGTGALGGAIARRLVGLNVDVRAYNRDPAKLEPLIAVGVKPCASATEAAAEANILLIAVTDITALDAVLFGEGGALQERRQPLLVIDVGTHCPAKLTGIAEKAIATGVTFLEAPVTGSVHDALTGALNFLAGGDDATVDAARPFLETLGKSVYHMGPLGSGNTAKLAMNLLVGAMALGLGEAVAMLESARLEVPKFLDALGVSGMKSPLYQRLGQRYLEQDFAARFSISNLEKDIGLARERARELGSPSGLSDRMAAVLGDIDPDIKKSDYAILLALRNYQTE